MSTTRPAWATDLVAVPATRRRSAVCTCGQDLDICTRNHCPRCGHKLRHLVVAAAA